jgi:rhamnosyltransferase
VRDDVRAGAVVVSFHPDADVIQNLTLLRRQVSHVVVVDNGSSEALLRPLREAKAKLGFELIENGENLGIARALNQGVRFLRDRGLPFVLLFDQDSTVTDGYVQTMMKGFAQSRNSRSLAILVPRYIDRRFGTVLPPPLAPTGHLEAATTSGSLMPTEIFGIAGFFAEELFIDGVDYEYSLRVRRLGFTIDECSDAQLLHSPGTPSYHRLLKSKPFQAANYSPVRRYYQERNKIWVTKRYWRTFLAFCFKQFVTSVKDLVKIVLVEDDKLRKCSYFMNGIWDGLLGRTGRMVER